MEEIIFHDNHEMEQIYFMYKLKCAHTKQNHILGSIQKLSKKQNCKWSQRMAELM